MTKCVADIHGHYVFGVDDGAASLSMSLEMIRAAYNQGARCVFCTSHNSAHLKKYKNNFLLLQKSVENLGIDIELYSGMEILCELDYLDEIIQGLNNGKLLPMGNSKYVLLEFSPWTDIEEITECSSRIRKETGFEPIIAHIERYIWVREDTNVIEAINEMQLKIQINAYSLVEESHEGPKVFARKLLAEKLVTFVGSDTHRSDHRPVSLTSGIKYIYDNCPEEYAIDVTYRNAEELLIK